nr:hypothetical protein [Tanacetum cinerariifolium]
NDNFNVFAIESEHPEQSKSVNDTYPIELDEHNVIIDSLDLSYDRERVNQDDDNDLANEPDLLASLIAKLKSLESDEVIHLEKEIRSKLSDLIRPFDYETLNNLYDLFVPQREKSSAQRCFSERHWYESQRIVNIAEAMENVGTPVVQKSGIRCYNCKEYGHVAREYLDSEPLQKVPNNDNFNVFAIESEHPEQSKSVSDTYPIELDEHNVIIDSLDMSYDREQVNQDDDNDLANEPDLLASLIAKLKCEIDDSKNRNKFLETSNKVLVDKLQ